MHSKAIGKHDIKDRFHRKCLSLFFRSAHESQYRNVQSHVQENSDHLHPGYDPVHPYPNPRWLETEGEIYKI